MAKKAYVVRGSYLKSTETEKSERAVKRPDLRTIHSSLREIFIIRRVFCIMAALTVAKMIFHILQVLFGGIY